MSDQGDRIKLAEAMGWRLQQEDGPRNHDSRLWLDPDGVGGYFTYALPNPLEDANDDYAVLEWMRGEGLIGWHNALDETPQDHYKIGDYARAALKVIEKENRE